MERLSDTAIEIINDLHTERLDYYSEYIPLIDAANRLAAYEDTGLEPEEIERIVDAYGRGHTLRTESAERLEIVREIKADRLRELVQAEQDGRLVVLPCKVGDVVYGFHQERTILPMVAKWIETDADGWTVAAQYAPMAPKFYLFSDFGKTVFLTREEAEAALAQKGGEV